MSKPIVVWQEGMRILVDPDDPDRVPKPMVEYKLTPEEIAEKYGHIKGDGKKPNIPFWKSKETNVKGEDEEMSKALNLDEKVMMDICRKHGTGKEGIKAVAEWFGINETQARNQIYLMKIKRKLEAERKLAPVEEVKAEVSVKTDKEISAINSHEEHVECASETPVYHNIDQPLPIETEEPDCINHPKQYSIGGIEVTDYIQAKLTPEQFEGFCIGVIIQYVSRYQHKGGVSDLKKAEWYLQRIIKVKGMA
jgi:hypothetical protein